MPDLTTWTLVTRDRGGRYFRPVTNAPTGTWVDVTTTAGSWTIPNGEAWVVPAQGQVVSDPADYDNVLTEDGSKNGKRVPIRWDAKPLHTFTPKP